MNHATESGDIIDHVQVCMYCRVGITFVPATVQWWSTTPNRTVRDDVVKARVYCKDGDQSVHRPDIDHAARLARYRASKRSEQVGLPTVT